MTAKLAHLSYHRFFVLFFFLVNLPVFPEIFRCFSLSFHILHFSGSKKKKLNNLALFSIPQISSFLTTLCSWGTLVFLYDFAVI